VTDAKRVLITGAGGFIGRWSVSPLVAKGYEVHAAISNSTPRGLPSEALGAVAHPADLLDESAIDALLKRVAPTHLLHFAWNATPGIYWTSPENARWLAAGQYLARRFGALGGRRAVMAGTCAEYDWTKAGVCVELSTPLAGETGGVLTPYVASKIAMQKALTQLGNAASLSTAWGRIFFQFGPHEHKNRLVPSVIRNLLMNQEALCTHGRQIRSFLHVADVGAAFALLLDSEVRGPVNVGSGERISLADLIHKIAIKIGRPELVRLGARSPATEEPPLLVPDTHRLRDEVGFTPRYALDEAIDDTVEWWRRHFHPLDRA
jgi:nucleoside-diphosphate-sugar epimerase